MLNKRRIRRPYEKKRVSKTDALIFGLGLVALLITVFIVSSIVVPDMSTKLDNLAYRVRTYYRKLIPHPKYLPTPGPQTAISVAHPELAPLLLDTEVHADPSDPTVSSTILQATPAILTLSPNQLADDENLLLPAASSQPATEEFVQLTGFTHQWQTWNNCGPATITTYMSYFGHTLTQSDAALSLKPNRDDKNVTPQELAAYVHSLGLGAMVRQGGSIDQLKQFLSNDIPVLVETWLVHDGDGLGHYRLITGYDEASGQFSTADSLNGPNHQVSYQQLDADWRVFNRLYVVIYSPDQAQLVASIIGEAINEETMYTRLLAETQADLEANPADPVAYFNQGEVLTRLGRYNEAVVAFDQARQLGLHWRRLWYQFTPFEAYYATGRYQDVLDLSEATLEGTGGLEEAYYYQGLALYATNQTGVNESFAAALAYNPNFAPAQDALNQLNQ